MAAKKDGNDVDVMVLDRNTIRVRIKGTTPLIINRMSEKAKHELLLPSGRKTAAERQISLKHDPIAEYRDSVYTMQDDAPALLGMLSTGFKNGMRTAALDMPGATKAQIGRLVYVNNLYVPVYGIPELFMTTVRSADMNKTPDIRTRAILPEWACELSISHASPILKSQAVLNLLAAAGITSGLGDGRAEKGTFNFGQYEMVDEDDPDWHRIVEHGGRKAQEAAIARPECYDNETRDLLAWYMEDAKRRGYTITEID